MSRLAKLESLLAADPFDTFILYGLAQEHAKLADWPRAIAFYDRTLAVDPAYCYAYFHKAKAQVSAGDLAAAKATVATGLAAAQRAGDSKALNELGELQIELDDA
ncbi:MAG: tetratricopeptide repeat protein [Phycisphaerales bacterium]